MTDREKVIQGLKCCTNSGRECGFHQGDNPDCPYSEEPDECLGYLLQDVLKVLGLKAPRVLDFDDIRAGEVYWLEQCGVELPWPVAMHHLRNAHLMTDPEWQDYYGERWFRGGYNVEWRCWTDRPTDEQRKEAKWNETDDQS